MNFFLEIVEFQPEARVRSDIWQPWIQFTHVTCYMLHAMLAQEAQFNKVLKMRF